MNCPIFEFSKKLLAVVNVYLLVLFIYGSDGDLLRTMYVRYVYII